MPSPINFRSFLREEEKKRQKGNKSTHYASNAVEKKWGAIYYFSFFDRSVACNHEIPGFEACVRWKRASSLRGSPHCSFCVQRSNVAYRSNNSQHKDVFPRWSVGRRFSRISCFPVYSQPGIGCLFRGPGMNHQQVS